MPAQGKTSLNININPALLAEIDTYRHVRMFPTRTAAIEFLLGFALKAESVTSNTTKKHASLPARQPKTTKK